MRTILKIDQENPERDTGIPLPALIPLPPIG